MIKPIEVPAICTGKSSFVAEKPITTEALVNMPIRKQINDKTLSDISAVANTNKPVRTTGDNA